MSLRSKVNNSRLNYKSGCIIRGEKSEEMGDGWWWWWYREDSVTEVAMDIAELVGGREVLVRWKGSGWGGHVVPLFVDFLFSFLFFSFLSDDLIWFDWWDWM